MQYHGKLFGHIPGTRKYFDTGKTSVDWDNMERENIALRTALAELVAQCRTGDDVTAWWRSAVERAEAALANANAELGPEAPARNP